MATALKFTQPTKGTHLYVADGGYEVRLNEDKKTWTATKDGDQLTTEAASRKDAFDLASKHATPEAPTADVSGEKAKAPTQRAQLNTREHTILKPVANAEEGVQVKMDTLPELSGLDKITVYSTLSTLQRRKFIEVDDDENVTLTEEGRAAFATVKERVAREPKAPKEPRDSKSMEDRYGPRDPELPEERPTEEEWQMARLKAAEASVELAYMGRRMHPYSPKAKDKHNSALERCKIIQEALDKARATSPKAAAEDPNSEEQDSTTE